MALSSILERFHAMVERAPDAIAVVTGSRAMSYAQLADRAARIAGRLRQCGVGAEQRVGLLLERSPDAIAAMLGILHAGAAYVPLDPAYPDDRIGYMIGDAGVRAVVTERRHARRADVESVFVDEVAASDPPAPVSVAAATGLAYVIYTSGSTGRPKGVMVDHHAVLNHTVSAISYYGLSPADRMLQFASLSFDASVEEIFGALCSGARLVLRDEAMMASLPAFAAGCVAHGVTVLDLPTAYWHELVVQLAAEAVALPPSVRLVIIGGEKASREHLARWFSVAGNVVLVDTYGPTEATIVASRCRAEPGVPELALGAPIDNAYLHLVSDDGELIAGAGTGEIAIGGAGLARGYLGRPALTAERFVPDPTGTALGARVYLTGDVGRRDSDGLLWFAGRRDDQVKLRGFRVELGEVAAAARRCAGVIDAAAAVVGDDAHRRLVLYYTGDATADTLSTELRAVLPGHIVPASLVSLAALPLNTSGKVDRAALPVPGPSRDSGDPIAAANEAEQILIEIWCEVLGVDQVGVDDDYFALGGDSILSFQLVHRARQRGLELTSTEVLQHRTVARQARIARRALAAAVAAVAHRSPGVAPLMPIQRWFLDEVDGDHRRYDQVAVLCSAGPVDAAALETAFAAVIEHHEALRLSFRRANGTWEQRAGDPTFALERAATLADMPPPSRLDGGPMVRAALVAQGAPPGDTVVVAIHHLVVDGVSWRILIDDLATAYDQGIRGEPIALPAPTTPFLTVASRLGERAADLPAWTEPTPRAWALPVDDPAGGNRERDAGEVVVSLSPAETRELLTQAPGALDAQIDDLLVGALVDALSRWTGAPGAALWLERHGRDLPFADIDLSRTVGWFTSMYPLWLDRPPGDSLAQVVAATGRRLAAVPLGGLGYGVGRSLLRAVDPAADPPVAFNYFGQLGGRGGGALWIGGAGIRNTTDPERTRAHPLEIDALVIGDRLEVRWGYSRLRHHRATIERIASDHLRGLRALIELARSEAVPATYIQRVLWYSDRTDPTSRITAANPVMIEIDSRVDADALELALADLAHRHEILRARFCDRDGTLWMEITDAMPVLETEDLRALPPEQREQAVAAAIAGEAAFVFDLERPPLVRARLLAVEPDRHLLVLKIHHIIVGTTRVIVRDLAALYAARAAGKTPRLPGAGPSYRAVARTQRRVAGDSAFGDHIAFWRQQLAAPAAVQFAGERAGGGDHSRQVQSLVTPDQVQRIEQLARRARVPAVIAYLCGYLAVVQARTGQTDLSLAVLDDGGRPPELEDVVGPFGSVLVFRVDLSGDPTFQALMQRALGVFDAVIAHRDVPPALAAVDAAGRIPGRLSRLGVNFLGTRSLPIAPAATDGDVRFTEIGTAVTRAKYDIFLQVDTVAAGVRLFANYKADMFDDALIRGMVDQYVRLLDAAADDPDRALSALLADSA